MGIGESLLRSVGTALWIVATGGFVVAGLGVLGVPLLEEWWRFAATASAIVSFLLIGLFWHRWFIVGLLLDVVILVALLLSTG
jgi:hypothetical protein